MVTTTSRRLSGSTATYTCNSGFELLDLTPGSDMRTCQPNGMWSGSEALCIGIYNYYNTSIPCHHNHTIILCTATCPELQNPANGMVTTTSRRLSGSTATYTCNPGFELLDETPGSDTSTCRPDGTWSGFETQCVGMLGKVLTHM